MNRIIRILLVASAMLSAATSAHAQKDPKLLAGADFDTYFDNREYSGCEFGESQTLFSSRLTPWIGFGWSDANRLMVGMDLLSNFGNDEVTFEKVRPQIYYRFENRKVSAYAGIFPRESMMGDYSEAILSDSVRFYDNRIQGFMGQYRGRRGFAELSVDWCGMYSEESREKFRILSAGEYWFDNYRRRFYGGYAFMMFHFAGSKRIVGCVNDNITIEPYVGARFEAYFDFDIRLRYIQTLQRDRANDAKYRTPKGGMLQARMSKWGLYIDERLYVGQGLQPYYSSFRSDDFPYGYGGELYAGERFFGTDKHVYNSTKIGYDRRFFDGTLRVNCYLAFKHDGTGGGTQQMVQLSVRLLKDIPLGKKR